MKKAGFSQGEEESVLSRLLTINQTAATGKEAIISFAKELEIADFFVKIGIEELYGPLKQDFPVLPIKGALEMLCLLSKNFDLAIVSMGKKEQQLFKLKKAGIDSSFFYKILCIEEGSKKDAYQMLWKEKQIAPDQVIVCGDKVYVDLLPAKELGFWTVHVKKGRGVYSTGPLGTVDVSITELKELPELLLRMKEQNIQERGPYGDK